MERDLLEKVSSEKRSGSLEYQVHFITLSNLQIFRHTVVVFPSGLLSSNNGTASCLKNQESPTWQKVRISITSFIYP